MEVKQIGVLGAGTMGHGIAQAAISAGFATVMYDVAQELVERGKARIAASLEKRIAKGKLSREEKDVVMDRLQVTASLPEAVREADLIIEAVPEDLALKKRIFAEIDGICKPAAILATNTSVLSVTAVAG
ncbi:MAG: 3-hydroxyacyl-CoA dehydrogenase NAD-binding domain-containing protein, partial [Syntrophales bacterium]|nr:3-hydroxyacyl-CoA dehydrogenase NAD-binding domain-containing protein [Syntrophales bacterium]